MFSKHGIQYCGDLSLENAAVGGAVAVMERDRGGGNFMKTEVCLGRLTTMSGRRG